MRKRAEEKSTSSRATLGSHERASRRKASRKPGHMIMV